MRRDRLARRHRLDRPPGARDRRRRTRSSSSSRPPRARTPIDGLAPLTQVGGDLTELLERAEPDVVLNAVVGFAGLPVTLWALERGVDLALANKESLVAAGELALAARERGGGRCCRSTASTPPRSSASRAARRSRWTRSS